MFDLQIFNSSEHLERRKLPRSAGGRRWCVDRLLLQRAGCAQLGSDQNRGCLLCVGDYTTQWDSKIEIRIANHCKDPVFTQWVYSNGMSCQGLVHVADMSSDEKTILFVKGFSCRILCKKSSSIYIPRTQMTLVLIGKGLVLRGWPSKIEAIYVLGIYIYEGYMI